MAFGELSQRPPYFQVAGKTEAPPPPGLRVLHPYIHTSTLTDIRRAVASVQGSKTHIELLDRHAVNIGDVCERPRRRGEYGYQ